MCLGCFPESCCFWDCHQGSHGIMSFMGCEQTSLRSSSTHIPVFSPITLARSSHHHQDQLCCVVQVRSRANTAQPLAAETRDIPMISSGNMSQGYQNHCIAMVSCALSSSAGWDLTMTSNGGAGHSQQAISTLYPFPAPSLFMALNLFLFSFSPLCLPHTCTS